MRIQQSQSNTSIISRQERPKPILPELISYLAEDSILQNQFHQKSQSYEISRLQPKKIEGNRNKEFQPFFNERDRLGRLLSKPRVQNQTMKNNDSSSLGLLKTSRVINQTDLQLQNQRRESTDKQNGLFKRGSLNLSSVAIMHLNEFYQSTIEQQKKTNPNYVLDELVDDKYEKDMMKLQTEENENISKISLKDNDDISHSKVQFDETTNNNEQNKRNSKILPNHQIKSMKSRFDQLRDFAQMFSKNEGVTPEADKLMQDLARMYTEKKRKMKINRKKETLPSIGQYDITKSDGIVFKKSPNPFISKDSKFHQKKEVKDSVEQYMQEVQRKKTRLSQQQHSTKSLKNYKNQIDEEDESLPFLNISALFDKMNQEFYKYPLEFQEKMEWAQKKVSKIQNDLKTWNDRCKSFFQDQPKDIMNN